MNPESDQADVALDERYRRLVRRDRLRRAPFGAVICAAFYLPCAKGAGAVRFLPLGAHGWDDALVRTAVMAIVWLVAFSFSIGRPVDPSGYGGLNRQDRATVDEALGGTAPPPDSLLCRVADERARLIVRRGEPGVAHVVGLGVALVVIAVLAQQWWVAVLWLGLWAILARSFWNQRGRATQAERYLTAPRRFVSRERIAELFKDAPSIDAAAFRRDLDELADQDPFPRR